MWRSSFPTLHRVHKISQKARLHRTLATASATNPFRGVWPIIATPFNEDESIDYKSFEKIIDFYSNEIGVNGCTIIGVLGESNRLVDSERAELISIATQVSSKPICVGTSHSGTTATIKLSEQALENGAHSVMITPSKEAVPDQINNIRGCYERITKAFGDSLRIVLQDHPASTQVHMTMDSLKHIIQHCPSVKCVKLESLPTPPKIRSLKPFIAERKLDCTILTGLGALYSIFDLECNSDGFMTGFVFSEILYAMYEQQVLLGNAENARQLYQRYLPLIVFEQQPGVAIRKELYQLRGILQCTQVRHPGKNVDQEVAKQLKQWTEWIFGSNVDLTKKLQIEVAKRN